MVKLVLGVVLGAFLLYGYQQEWHENVEWEAYPVKIEFDVPIPVVNDENSML